MQGVNRGLGRPKHSIRTFRRCESWTIKIDEADMLNRPIALHFESQAPG